jgi:outer membrane protein OmpA-like peptidoglycan-associated protein
MNFNILSFVKEQLSGYVIGKMSDFLGENPYKTASALENVLPVVLGGLVNKSSNTLGAGQIMDQIKDAGHDGKVFDNLNDIVKEPDAMLDWLSSGSALSNHIFDDKLGAVIDGISGENDIRKTSAASLLSFLTPLVLGAVGKHVTGNSLGISGILDLMSSNRSVAEQSLTPDMKYTLGMDGSQRQAEKTSIITDKQTQTNTPVQGVVNPTKKPADSSNWTKWLLPLLLVGLLGSLAYYFLKKKRDDASTSFFDKWAKKDTAVSTANGDSLKLKLDQRRKDSELTDKAKQLSKSGSDSNKTTGSLLSNTEDTNKGSKSTEKRSSTNFSSNSDSKSTSGRSGGRRSRGNNTGSDIIEEIDGSSPSYNYSGGSSSGPAKDLSSAIRNRSLNSEFAIDGISFTDGGYEFIGSSQNELARLASILKRHPRAKIFIQGFAMNGDSEDQELSQMRAEWVRYALIDRGVKSSRIEARGHCQPNQSTLSTIPRNKVSMKLVGI